ncbi:MAG: HDIG domain-containing protein [Acidimicrobiales bacterium]|nr:HDIG domain-containing protein [Acidimicrobiales bacterium]
MFSVDHRRDTLTTILLAEDPAPGLWELVDSGTADEVVPELTGLRLEQDPIHRHKDVLAHTIAVVSQTRAELSLRLAALFHDIGKPSTRSYEHGGVTFRHHEAVGAKITRRRLKELEFPKPVVDDVTELVRLSGRFKGYADGWSDSAVRRYARDAGHLLGLLNELVRSDCTTRNPRKRVELQGHVDDLEERIAELAEQARRDAERPLIDGAAVMERLGIGPGRDVGEALRFLLELRRSEPELELAATEDRLDEWWAKRLAERA